jgi:hypothetical protein
VDTGIYTGGAPVSDVLAEENAVHQASGGPVAGSGSGGTSGSLAGSLGLPPTPTPTPSASQLPGSFDQINALAPTAAGPVGAGLPSMGAAEVLDNGFPVARLPASDSDASGTTPTQLAGDERLFVYQGMQNPQSTRVDALDLQVPREAFGHTNPSAVVRLEATLADGSPLPGWIQFDNINGTFRGDPPNPAAADVDIKVTARDEAGRQAEVTFRPVIAAINPHAVQPGGPADVAGASGGSGFPIERFSNLAGNIAGLSSGPVAHLAGDQRLFVYRGVQGAQSESAERYEYSVPKDAFAHTDPSAVVRLEATLADGSPLPAWLQFDAQTGRLSGTPLDGNAVQLEIRITARDQAGREANVVFAPAMAAAAEATSADQDAYEAKLVAGVNLLAGVSAGIGLKLAPVDGGEFQPSSFGGADALSGWAAAPMGFPVVRFEADAATGQASGEAQLGVHRLYVYHGLTDMHFTAGRALHFSVPNDAFAHTDPGATVLLEARLADGSALPAWLTFNSVTGTFTGMPPGGITGALDIEVTARDEDGRIARLQFKLELDAVTVDADKAQRAEVASAQDAELMYEDAAAEAGMEANAALADADAAIKAKAEAEKARQRGSVPFSEQLHAVKVSRDPVLARILADQPAKPVRPVA